MQRTIFLRVLFLLMRSVKNKRAARFVERIRMDGVSGYLSFLMDKLEAMLCTGNYQVGGKLAAASPDFPSNVRGPKQPVGAPVYGLSTGVSGSGFIIPIDGN